MAEVKILIPPKLIPVFQGSADIRGSYGGRGSSKTRTFAKMTAIRAYMWEKAGREGIILCGRQFMNSLAESSLEEIKSAIRSEDWLLPHFDIGDKYIKTISGRIQYVFTGLDRNIDSVKSKSRILLAWVDEAEPVTEEAWQKLIPTLREEDSELWVTWNPESKRSPTHKRFRLSTDSRIKIVEMNWRDNWWFPKILERQRNKDKLERPDSYAHIWEGDFALAVEGAYYTRELIDLKEKVRIKPIAYEPSIPVHTAWDLGIGDSTAIWWFQIIGNEIWVLDCYENHGKALPHYAGIVKSKLWQRGHDYVPHDARVRELGTGKTRIETMLELGLNPKLAPNGKIEDGINAVRSVLHLCWFNDPQTEIGLDALRQYRPDYDQNALTFKDRPLHNWTSHFADAFRYLAMSYQAVKVEVVEPPQPLFKPTIELTFDEFFKDVDSADKRERI